LKDAGAILVADADRECLAASCEVLRSGGYEPIPVSDGAEALGVYSRNSRRIGVVLTDVSLPTLSGLNLVKVIRRLRPRARVMVAAANWVESKFAEWREIGVTSFVPKPCAAGDLLAGLRRLLVQP
jgi:DNA-binding NtrC family response regulator